MSYVRTLALVLAGSLTLGACQTRATRNMAIIAGGTIAAASLAFIAKNWIEPENAFEQIVAPPNNLGVVLVGGIGLLGGGAIALVGVASDPGPETFLPLPSGRPGAGVAPPSPRPLPMLATDDQTLQLARQARRAALNYHCSAVTILVDEIAARDDRYATALINEGVVAPCR
jgi:hypothetical protein